MNNANLIKGIAQTIEGLTVIMNELSVADQGAVADEVVTTKKEEKAVVKTETPKVKEEKAETSTGDYTREQLNAMKYNELKKLGASLGVKCVGTRDEITDKILAVGGAVEEDQEEVVEVKETKKADKKVTSIEEGKKKLGKKKEEVVEEPQEDEFEVQAKEIAEETDKEDIIEALKEVGVKATSKNYVSKLADALRQGLIDLDEEDEEEEEEVESDEDGEDIDYHVHSTEFDPKGYNDPANMTEERANAIEQMVDEVIEQIANEEIGEDDITSYIEEFSTEDEQELLSDDYTEEQLIKFYLELRKRMIDDEGNEAEPADPYELMEKNFCCGHELKYSKKNKQYICEVCATEYEAE